MHIALFAQYVCTFVCECECRCYVKVKVSQHKLAVTRMRACHEWLITFGSRSASGSLEVELFALELF